MDVVRRITVSEELPKLASSTETPANVYAPAESAEALTGSDHCTKRFVALAATTPVTTGAFVSRKTVRSAARVEILPARFVTKTRNSAPLSARVASASEYSRLLAPMM